MRNQGWPINPQYLAGAPLQILHSVNMIYTRRNLIPKFVCISAALSHPTPHDPTPSGDTRPFLNQEDFILIYWLGYQEEPSGILKAPFLPRPRRKQLIYWWTRPRKLIPEWLDHSFFAPPRTGLSPRCLRRLNEHKSSLEMVIAGKTELSKRASTEIIFTKPKAPIGSLFEGLRFSKRRMQITETGTIEWNRLSSNYLMDDSNYMSSFITYFQQLPLSCSP